RPGRAARPWTTPCRSAARGRQGVRPRRRRGDTRHTGGAEARRSPHDAGAAMIEDRDAAARGDDAIVHIAAGRVRAGRAHRAAAVGICETRETAPPSGRGTAELTAAARRSTRARTCRDTGYA